MLNRTKKANYRSIYIDNRLRFIQRLTKIGQQSRSGMKNKATATYFVEMGFNKKMCKDGVGDVKNPDL